jgi:hypothetical protein
MASIFFMLSFSLPTFPCLPAFRALVVQLAEGEWVLVVQLAEGEWVLVVQLAVAEEE